MPKDAPDLIPGTLDMLILQVLDVEPMHGWGIQERIHHHSGDVLQVNQGSLYPALHRLTRQGWIASRWGTSRNGRRAKFYELTPAGSAQLRRERSHWLRLSGAVNRVLGST